MVKSLADARAARRLPSRSGRWSRTTPTWRDVTEPSAAQPPTARPPRAYPARGVRPRWWPGSHPPARRLRPGRGVGAVGGRRGPDAPGAATGRRNPGAWLQVAAARNAVDRRTPTRGSAAWPRAPPLPAPRGPMGPTTASRCSSDAATRPAPDARLALTLRAVRGLTTPRSRARSSSTSPRSPSASSAPSARSGPPASPRPSPTPAGSSQRLEDVLGGGLRDVQRGRSSPRPGHPGPRPAADAVLARRPGIDRVATPTRPRRGASPPCSRIQHARAAGAVRRGMTGWSCSATRTGPAGTTPRSPAGERLIEQGRRPPTARPLPAASRDRRGATRPRASWAETDWFRDLPALRRARSPRPAPPSSASTRPSPTPSSSSRPPPSPDST